MTIKNITLAAGLLACNYAMAGQDITITYEVIGSKDPTAQSIKGHNSWERLSVDDRDVRSVIDTLQKDPTIGSIELPQEVSAIRPINEVYAVPTVRAMNASPQSYSDPEFSQQEIWRSSASGGPGSHSIEQAMGIFDNSRKVRLGVVDGGFVETNDLNYADGANLVSGQRGATFLENEIDPLCDFRHGTKVAHVAAARSNNGIGMAGILNADVFAARVFVCEGGGSSVDIADAILYLSGESVSGVPQLDKPVQVINLSLGGVGRCPNHVQAALDAAQSKGIISVVSAGNDNGDTSEKFPANCEGVVVAAANTFDGQRASFSNDGDEVDIFATGTRVFTTSDSGEYYFVSGTSFSAPIVSAHVGLIKAAEPHADEARVESLMNKTDIPLDDQRDAFAPGILDSLGLARELTGGSYSAPPFSHALLHEDRANIEAYTQAGTGLSVCNIYEVDTKKLGLELQDGLFYRVVETPKENDLLMESESIVASSNGSRVLVKNMEPESYSYGLSMCNSDNSTCSPETPINLNAEGAFTRSFCNRQSGSGTAASLPSQLINEGIQILVDK